MSTVLTKAPTALTAPNQIVEVDGRDLAYRTFGTGPNLVLCVRLRGTMDMWDPLFLAWGIALVVGLCFAPAPTHSPAGARARLRTAPTSRMAR